MRMREQANQNLLRPAPMMNQNQIAMRRNVQMMNPLKTALQNNASG